MTDQMLPTEETLRTEVTALREELEKLNNHRFVRIHNAPWRMIFFQFLRGLGFGLGTVVGAGLLVSILSYSLTQIDFIPILGDWAVKLAAEIETSR